MAQIRKFNFLDGHRVKKLVSQIGCDYSDIVLKTIIGHACCILHSFVPLKYRFLPETFLYLENDEIIGLITVVPTRGNPYKINIIRLIFKQNDYEVGKQLLEFVISRFGARGATTFYAAVDLSHEELINLFINSCGFRQCSYENLWKIENFTPQNKTKAPFRYCQNSDAKAVADLYNNELKNIFKPAMERAKEEYKEPFFEGLTNFYKNRYVLEEPAKHKIIAYLSITTTDNLNFIIDMSINDAYGLDYDSVLNFALGEISRRKTTYYAFLKHRQYTKTADNLEEYLHKNNLNCIQTQYMLVKDFYKPIKETENNPIQVFLLGENKVWSN